ncbi:hypothetical protein ACYVOZ_003417 [Vibrio cholerae]
MVEQYKPMITDYFYISNLIKNYVQKNEVEHWDTEYIMFEFYSASKSKEYDAKDLAKALDATENQVQNFFVVHCCLSNYLYDLIGDREYSTWFVEDGSLNVSYSNDMAEQYDIADISLLMKKTEEANWSFSALVESWNEIHKQNT